MPEEEYPATVVFSVILRTLLPIASSGMMGLPRTCTKLAEKGLLTESDIVEISFDALRPFDNVQTDGDPILQPIALTLDRLRGAVEAEWDKAIRAAYHAKKRARAVESGGAAPLKRSGSE